MAYFDSPSTVAVREASRLSATQVNSLWGGNAQLDADIAGRITTEAAYVSRALKAVLTLAEWNAQDAEDLAENETIAKEVVKLRAIASAFFHVSRQGVPHYREQAIALMEQARELMAALIESVLAQNATEGDEGGIAMMTVELGGQRLFYRLLHRLRCCQPSGLCHGV